MVYFTSFFPYAVLSALAVRGFTMPGAADGIAFLFQPKWELLANPQIWTDAATQGKLPICLVSFTRGTRVQLPKNVTSKLSQRIKGMFCAF